MFNPHKPFRGLDFSHEKTRCQKHLAKQCDINNIIARVVRGDRSDIVSCRYGDFRGISDNPHENMLKVIEAKNSYYDLPESVHEVYPSVEAYYAALNDPHEWDRLRELGVMLPKEESTDPVSTDPVSGVNPPPSNGGAHA